MTSEYCLCHGRDTGACIYQASPGAKSSITVGTKKNFWVATEKAKWSASIYLCPEMLDKHQPLKSERLFYLCFGCVMSPAEAVCYRFICAEKGTGGWRAPWPLERAVISPAIMWLHPTPSRQKSKKSFFFFLLCLMYQSFTNHMKELTLNTQIFLLFISMWIWNEHSKEKFDAYLLTFRELDKNIDSSLWKYGSYPCLCS